MIIGDLSTTREGHLEVAIHEPILPFGSVHVENMMPIFQTDAVYLLNDGQTIPTTTLSGTTTVSNSMFNVTTGTTVGGAGIIQSRKRLRYRAGQGVIGRFTSLYTTPVASSYQLAGFGHAEDGIYVGYKNLDFGILYSHHGVREIETLTVTVASSTAENITVKLAGVDNTVAVTNSGNIQRTVWEIAQGTYSGWKAYPSGSTVVFVANDTGDKSGVFSITATTATGTFAETRKGVANTETFIKQTEWSSDKLDGNGFSRFTLDPSKLNLWQINIPYLGAGAIAVKCMVTYPENNNANFVTVHLIKIPNTLTQTSFGNPSFPFTMAVYSAGSTTDLTVKVGSFAGFIEGNKMLHGNRFSYYNQLTTVGATNYQCLMTLMNVRSYSGRANQAVINMLSVSGAIKHTSPVIYYLVRNATLVGNPSFSSVATNSCGLIDTSATTCTFDQSQVVWTGHIGDTGEIDHHFGNGSYNVDELTIQPGEWFTLCAKSTTGTPAYVTGSINTREDQ